MRASEIFIKTKQGPLDENLYEDKFKEYNISTIHFQRIPQEDMEKEFPRYLIGYNAEYTNIFIELLQTGNEECKREVLKLLDILPVNQEFKEYLFKLIKDLQPNAEVKDW